MALISGSRRFALFGVAVLFCTLALSSPVAADWQMVWSDEFDGTSLNSSKWDIEVNCWGGGNNEKQCYTARSSNVFVSGGALHLAPIAGTYQGSNTGCTLTTENSCTWTQPATSGRVRTLKAIDGSWKYGRFEACARLPKGNFLWPAFWMLPTDSVYGVWAASGEIDIMEARGQHPYVTSSTLHYGGTWPNNVYTTSDEKTLPFDLTADFHVYALEWTETAMTFYVDSTVVWTQSLAKSFGSNYAKNGQPFDQKFHILLNVAVAGGFFDSSLYGNFDINTAAPTWTQDYAIDYVRVYKASSTPTAPPTAPIAPAPVASPTKPPTSAPISAPTPTTNAPSSSAAFTVQVPLLSASDSYVDSLRSGMNFASESTLSVRQTYPDDGSVERIAYLKFFLPIGTSAPTAASLNLYGSSEGAPATKVSVTVSVLSSNAWTEDALTYNSKPEICTSCASWGATANGTSAWMKFDVLSVVQSALASGKSVISFAVRVSNGAIAINSNNAPTNKPMLNIAY